MSLVLRCTGQYYESEGTNRMLRVLALACLLLLAAPLVAFAGDPTGTATGGASDVVAANSAAPTLQELLPK